jgi:hypothetical protein
MVSSCDEEGGRRARGASLVAERWILIDADRPQSTETAISVSRPGGKLRMSAADAQAALGWTLEPEGLCRGEVCMPVRDRAGLVSGDGIDLEALASLLGRPLARDDGERMAVLGVSATERAARLASLEAPDFSLPDLSGKQHSLHQHRGKKVLLIAYASW